MSALLATACCNEAISMPHQRSHGSYPDPGTSPVFVFHHDLSLSLFLQGGNRMVLPGIPGNGGFTFSLLKKYSLAWSVIVFSSCFMSLLYLRLFLIFPSPSIIFIIYLTSAFFLLAAWICLFLGVLVSWLLGLGGELRVARESPNPPL